MPCDSRSSGMSFTVLGRPQPAGSKRAFVIRKAGQPTGRVAVADANPRAKSWQQEVAAAALKAADGRMFARGTPVVLYVRFVLGRPKSHYGTGRNAGTLKATAAAYPTTAPDTTKLLRGLEDALTAAGVWHDDAQVVDQHACKFYGWPERCEVTITPLLPTVGGQAMQEEAA